MFLLTHKNVKCTQEQLDGKPLIVVSCVSILTVWRLHCCCTLSESINPRAKRFLRWPSFFSEGTYSLVFAQLYWNISSLKSEINTALISDRCIRNACVAGAAVTSLTSSHQIQPLQIGTDPEFSFMRLSACISIHSFNIQHRINSYHQKQRVSLTPPPPILHLHVNISSPEIVFIFRHLITRL